MYYIWRVEEPSKPGDRSLKAAIKRAQAIIMAEGRDSVIIVKAEKRVERIKPVVQVNVLPFED